MLAINQVLLVPSTKVRQVTIKPCSQEKQREMEYKVPRMDLDMRHYIRYSEPLLFLMLPQDPLVELFLQQSLNSAKCNFKHLIIPYETITVSRLYIVSKAT
jgi:hypothetical protein